MRIVFLVFNGLGGSLFLLLLPTRNIDIRIAFGPAFFLSLWFEGLQHIYGAPRDRYLLIIEINSA